MEHEVPPGELNPGDIITLPGSSEQLLVKRVRLGKGGFILTVSPAGNDLPETERLVTLTAATQLRKSG